MVAGSLIMEEYSWKSIQSGKFVLRLTTTGTKGTSIALPPGLAINFVTYHYSTVPHCGSLHITTVPCCDSIPSVVMSSSCM